MIPGISTGGGGFTGSSRADSAAEAVGGVTVSGSGNIHFAPKNNWLGIAALVALALVSVAAIASSGKKS